MAEQLSRRLLLEKSLKTILYATVLPATTKVSSSQSKTKLKLHVPAETLISELTNLMPYLMSLFNVPGLSIFLIRDTRLLWNKGFGIKSVDTKEEVTPNTVFEAASLSKPVFAYAVLKLCESGVLELDTHA